MEKGPGEYSVPRADPSADRVACRTTPSPLLERLSSREREVLRHVAAGSSNAEIAAVLFLGETTVRTSVSHLLAKLGARDRVGLVVAAYEEGLVRAAGA